ncbi:NUDIX hydrolase [Agromyces sp. ZXT2-3]|uniref:NUDIX hydrolase n=1 Tax=Agromyces sp. ZXT2-3 TaxID=3461152 RepID=UPI004054FB37
MDVVPAAGAVITDADGRVLLVRRRAAPLASADTEVGRIETLIGRALLRLIVLPLSALFESP